MKKSIFLLLFAMLFFIPIGVKADTWLDKEEYRDTSWFDESTYDTTTEYTLNTAQKVAGFLYLVNEQGYTFDDKIVKLEGECDSYQVCLIDMRGHDWVPLNDRFNGLINNNSSGGVKNYLGFEYYDGFKFSKEDKDNICDNSDCSYLVSNEWYLIRYISSIYKKINNGDIVVDNQNLENETIIFSVTPDDGYYLDDLEITDYDGNIIKYMSFNETSFRFTLPKKNVTIKAIIKEKNKQKCTIIKGTGRNLGDEIACGEEHFYVLENDSNKIRMLSKYNLHTGVSIYKEKIEKEDGDIRTDSQYCSDLATSKGGVVKSDGFYNTPGYCFYTKMLPKYKIVQTEDSKSAHWDADLNYLYPQVGDVYMLTGAYNAPTEVSSPSKIGNTYFYDYIINLEIAVSGFDDAGILYPMYLYKKRLINNGINVSDISLISLTELNNLANSLSGNYLPLEEWSENVESASYPLAMFNFGNIKPYIPDKYKWLYSTTYWNRSYYDKTDHGLNPKPYASSNNRLFVFTAEQGKICGAGFSNCAIETTLGCGIRPVVTIPASDVTYKINTKTDGNGTIEVVDNSAGGKTILFRLNGKKGFSLNKLIITTDSGETVEFTEGDLIKNDDGTITIDNNKFTMPFESVTIKATWKISDSSLINPPTGDSIKIYVLTLITTFGLETFLYIYVKKKYLNKKEF